jgi:tRNA(fMet)-specific endonuclease VapC
MYLLDTDHLSLLERGGADSLRLQMRLDHVPAEEIATTIITYMAYSRLQRHVETFRGIPIVPFEERALSEFTRLRQARIRIGTMDLKIAAIALAHEAMLLSRNLSDFGKVPGLRVEDWTE